MTFGGAYAILPHVSQVVVNQFSWISPGQMMDALSLAESTPGPLIIVLQFIGFLAGYQNAMSLSPVSTAILASLVTSWCIFTPSWIWVFTFAPFSDRVTRPTYVRGALSGIMAAVVGNITFLGIWFAWHIVHSGSLNLYIMAATITTFSILLQVRFNYGVMKIVGIAVLGCVLLAVFQ